MRAPDSVPACRLANPASPTLVERKVEASASRDAMCSPPVERRQSSPPRLSRPMGRPVLPPALQPGSATRAGILPRLLLRRLPPPRGVVVAINDARRAGDATFLTEREREVLRGDLERPLTRFSTSMRLARDERDVVRSSRW
jgi:hypothetical protein